jgi:hypothetical protein
MTFVEQNTDALLVGKEEPDSVNISLAVPPGVQRVETIGAGALETTPDVFIVSRRTLNASPWHPNAINMHS